MITILYFFSSLFPGGFLEPQQCFNQKNEIAISPEKKINSWSFHSLHLSNDNNVDMQKYYIWLPRFKRQKNKYFKTVYGW